MSGRGILLTMRIKGSTFAAAAVAVLITFSTCELPLSFGPEYFNTATNFIAGRPLALTPLASDHGTDIPLGSTGIWDWAWRGNTGDPFDYMELTNEGPSGGASDGGFILPATETAWRLELVNLMPDPAYFETMNDLDVLDDWLIGGVGASIAINQTASSRGKELLLVSEGHSWVGFNPLTMFKTAPLPDALYSFYARTTTVPPIYNVETASDISYTKLSRIIRSDILGIENFAIPSTDHRFKFGKENPGEIQTISLDEVRALRVDLVESWRLRLLLTPEDTIPSLVPGYYEFSIWVRVPDDALTPEDAVGRMLTPEAALAASRIRLAMTQVAFLEGSDTPSSVTESFPVSGSWKRWALRMAPRSNFDRFNEGTDEAVIELAIYPFASNEAIDAGAILIAEPSLRFFANGY